jgi:hypothetical protein
MMRETAGGMTAQGGDTARMMQKLLIMTLTTPALPCQALPGHMGG